MSLMANRVRIPPDASHDASALAREARLIAWLTARGSILVGLSGGVDSVYLAAVAVETLGPDHVLGVIGVSPSYPDEQWRRARDVADAFHIPVLEVATHELDDPRYAANPANRCFFCKSELWERLIPIARERAFAVVADGTNADDLTDHRPGARAARERGVVSPLAELGFTKAEIRARSHARHLPTWSQPSSPCLSSRLPYGTAVTRERLRQIERAEAALRGIGVAGDLRVRYHGHLARIELGTAQLDHWLSKVARGRLSAAVRGAGFSRVAVDLSGFRSGSLNALAGVTPAAPGGRTLPIADGGMPAEPSRGNLETERLVRSLSVYEGISGVEVEGRLVVLRCAGSDDSPAIVDPERRAEMSALVRSFGFTHVAVEVPPGTN
jgi:pyridinium-3,5-biscarboxylic acid mononucleotide sulfurtransferase